MAFGAPFPGSLATRFFGGSATSITSLPHTYSGFSLGPVDPNRILIAAISYFSTAGPLSGVTIDGLTPTQLAIATNGNNRAEIYGVLDSSSNTTGNVVITGGLAANPRVGIGLYALYGAASLTPRAKFQGGGFSGSLANGGVIIACNQQTNSGSNTWTGLTKDYEAQLGAESNWVSSASSQQLGNPASFSVLPATGILLAASW